MYSVKYIFYQTYINFVEIYLFYLNVKYVGHNVKYMKVSVSNNYI